MMSEMHATCSAHLSILVW